MLSDFFHISTIQVVLILLFLLLLASGIMVLLSSSNPVESVLFLVAVFITSGFILMTHLSSFFGVVVIIIYVGAIAVLFLFVIMMLNIKDSDLGLSIFGFLNSKISRFSLAVFFLSLFYFFINSKLSKHFLVLDSLSMDLFSLDDLNHLQIIGQVLYNYHIDLFLIAGIVLLVALLGSIALTFDPKVIGKGPQIINKQISRSDKFIAFF